MKLWILKASSSAIEGVGCEVPVVEFSVVFDGKLEAAGLCFEEAAGIGCSFARSRYVSAATMPPMECPTNITCTDGSIVGAGVEWATSMSITLF
jgi:hypothetical protein